MYGEEAVQIGTPYGRGGELPDRCADCGEGELSTGA